MRLTVGPLPPAVYWRRRALVLAGALLVLFLIVRVWQAAAPAGEPAAESSPGATTAPPSSPDTPTPLPATVDDTPAASGNEPVPDPEFCTDQEILVTAEASETTFPVGDTVTFTIRISHNADRSCRRDVGGSLRDLYLVRGTGAERVWSSRDCANPTGHLVVELSSGVERTHHIDFVGRSTSECDGGNAAGPLLPPGQYTLYASLGTARSEPVTITLQ